MPSLVNYLDEIFRLIAFPLGAFAVYVTLRSAIRTFLLPRSAPDFVSTYVYVRLRQIFNFVIKHQTSFEEKDRIMAYLGPVGILVLLVVWLITVLCGYTLMYWSIGAQVLGLEPWLSAFTVSGSSLFTLGYAPVTTLPEKLLSFSEAAIGPMLIALLIGYMPTIYGAFSKREALVNMLEVRAGSPPSATDLIIRFTRLHNAERINQMWVDWERWFAELEETHTSLAMLSFFRSPTSQHSWVTASGAVLDGAAMVVAVVDIPPSVQASLVIRSGYLALRGIANFFEIPYDPDPKPDAPISVSYEAFQNALDILAEEGVPLKADREQAWRDWRGWRVNYDAVLLALARLTMAPPAPWSSPEMPEQRRPPKEGAGA